MARVRRRRNTRLIEPGAPGNIDPTPGTKPAKGRCPQRVNRVGDSSMFFSGAEIGGGTRASSLGRNVSVAIIGNGPVDADRADEIDGADVVVRFDGANGFREATGSKVDQLVVRNFGIDARPWAEGVRSAQCEAFERARTIILPVNPESAAFIVPALDDDEWLDVWNNDHTDAIERVCREAGKTVVVFGASFYRAAMRDLGYCGMERDQPTPSMAYLTTRWWVLHAHRARVQIRCFAIAHEGDLAHDWKAERRWFERQERAGRLSLRDGQAAHRLAS